MMFKLKYSWYLEIISKKATLVQKSLSWRGQYFTFLLLLPYLQFNKLTDRKTTIKSGVFSTNDSSPSGQLISKTPLVISSVPPGELWACCPFRGEPRPPPVCWDCKPPRTGVSSWPWAPWRSGRLSVLKRRGTPAGWPLLTREHGPFGLVSARASKGTEKAEKPLIMYAQLKQVANLGISTAFGGKFWIV